MQVRLTNDSGVRRRSGAGVGTKRSSGSDGAGATTPVSAERSPFLDILEEVIPSNRPESRDLHALWKSLPETERELLEHPSNANLARYRELVFAIARQTLRQNTRIKKIRRKNRKGELVELSVVEFIDDRLQRMAAMMSAPGNSAFFMLKTVEEIRGALLDVRE